MNVDKMKELAGTEVKSTGPAKEFEIPPCYRIFDKAWFCVTPMNQIAKYYVHGELDNCLIPMNDWTLCMTAKLYTKEAMKQVRVSMIIRDMLDKCTLLPQDFQKAHAKIHNLLFLHALALA